MVWLFRLLITGKPFRQVSNVDVLWSTVVHLISIEVLDPYIIWSSYHWARASALPVVCAVHMCESVTLVCRSSECLVCRPVSSLMHGILGTVTLVCTTASCVTRSLIGWKKLQRPIRKRGLKKVQQSESTAERKYNSQSENTSCKHGSPSRGHAKPRWWAFAQFANYYVTNSPLPTGVTLDQDCIPLTVTQPLFSAEPPWEGALNVKSSLST